MARQPNQDPPWITRRSSARNEAPPQTSTSPSSIPDLQVPMITSGRVAQMKPRFQGLVTSSSKTYKTALASSDKRKREGAEEERTEDEAAPAPLSKRHKQAPTSLHRQELGSSTGKTSVVASTIRVSTRTTRQAQPPLDDTPETADDGSTYFPIANSSSLSDAYREPRYSSASAIAKVEPLSRSRPQQNIVVPLNSQLARREQDEAKAASKAVEKQVQETSVSAQALKPRHIQGRSQLKAELDAKDTDATTGQSRKGVGATAKRKPKKQQKAAELLALDSMPIPAPLPYILQLPDLPPRQNHTGRDLKVNLVTPDPTFPLSPAARAKHTATLVDSIRDCRIAQDKVTLTTNYWHVWLKQVHAGMYTYKEIDMERVCRKLVNIAEALHDHGLGATDIYCPETIKKAMAAQPMKFADRIEKLATLMRKTKARCNDFMLGNTLEDTVALIDLKVSDQKSNSANNYLRSLRVEEANKFFQVSKGTKWPKGENGKPFPPSELHPRGYGTLVGTAFDGVKDEHNVPHEGGNWQHAEALQLPVYPQSNFVYQQEDSQEPKLTRDWLRDVDMTELDVPDVDTPAEFSATSLHGVFDGFQNRSSEVKNAHSNIRQPLAGYHLFAPTLSAHMGLASSSFDNSSISSAHGGFNDPGLGDFRQMDTQVGMPPLALHNTARAFAGCEYMPQHLQPPSVHDARPEPTQVFVSGRADHKLLENSMRRHESQRFRLNPVTRAAKHESREFDERQGEGIAQTVNNRQRCEEAEADASKDRQGVSTNAILRGQSAEPFTKRDGGLKVAKVAGLSKSCALAREYPTLGKVADAEKDGRARETDGKRGEDDFVFVVEYHRTGRFVIEDMLRAEFQGDSGDPIMCNNGFAMLMP